VADADPLRALLATLTPEQQVRLAKLLLTQQSGER
jgi:hypothetical protein